MYLIFYKSWSFNFLRERHKTKEKKIPIGIYFNRKCDHHLLDAQHEFAKLELEYPYSTKHSAKLKVIFRYHKITMYFPPYSSK